jgi:hypothetical protein
MKKCTLIDGTFNKEEAKEIIMNLFSEKIRFHESKILSKKERRELGIEQHEERITALKEGRNTIKELLFKDLPKETQIKLFSELTYQVLS